jgi:periplasmic copper chaperone A
VSGGSRGPLRRRQLLMALPVLAAGLATSGPARAHSYPEDGFTVIHPWCEEAPSGTQNLLVQLRIVEIYKPDRLLAASTPVAGHMSLRTPSYLMSTRQGDSGPGVALHPGRDLVMNRLTPHFVLDRVNTDLQFGYEYPLTLVFERVGEVSAALIVGLD